MGKAAEGPLPWPICSLLLFVATSAEEEALQEQAAKLGLPFRKHSALTKHFREKGLGDDAWSLATIGGETVVAVGCSRIKGRPVMGPHGRLGSAAKGIRYLAATGAQGIIQVGMAFGIARGPQKVGDVSILLKSVDPKHNKFTIDLIADDKTTEKKDRTANEPVQFMTSKAKQPYELIVNDVKKDTIAGYLSVPKVQNVRN